LKKIELHMEDKKQKHKGKNLFLFVS